MEAQRWWPEDRPVIEGFDGVRAIAALAIVVFHVHTTMLPAEPAVVAWVARHGWMGVDLFFTLSGFLITGILLRTRGRPGYFTSFYKRRVLRIFPLYYGAVGLLLARRWLRDGPVAIPAWAALLFQTNWYAASAEEDLGLVVTWSLSIEEQFYLVWPALVLWAPLARLPWLIGGVAVLAPVYRAWVHDPSNLASYMFTPGRLDALGLGALAAVVWHLRMERAVDWAGRLTAPAVGLMVAMLVWGVSDRADWGVAVVGYSVFAALTAVALLGVASGGAPWLTRGLSWAPLVAVGRVSYGLYLLHPLVLSNVVVFGRAAGLPFRTEPWAGVVGHLVVAALSVGLATVSFHLIESPILALKDRWAPTPRAGGSGG
jgi:peptidoglycan/LPS O-acetylase OafA/YrhL